MRAVLFAIIGLACATVTPVLAQVTIEKNVVPAAPAPQGPVTQGLGGLTQYCGGFAGYTCGANQWCDFPVGSICGLGDQLGVCKPRPQVCTDQFIPVCGCDGKTYSNACQAAAGGTDVAYAGACRSPITAVGGGAAGQTAISGTSSKVGTLSDVYAWKNVQPGPGAFPSLHVTGKIVVPNPCYTTSTDYAGDSASTPPVYRVRVNVIPPSTGTNCIQMIVSKEFRYDQPNYTGMHKMLEAFSDTDSKTVEIVVVQ